MQALLRSSLIVAGLAFTAAVGSTPTLADQNNHGHKAAAQQRHAAKPHAAPPAANHKHYGNAPKAQKPAHNDRNANRGQDRHHVADRNHDRTRRDNNRQGQSRRSVDRHHHDRDRGHRNVYVRRDFRWSPHFTNNWDRYHNNGWLRYSTSRFGLIPRHNRGFAGYGADWMWWGGAYDPFNPPLGFDNCYPVIRYGYYDGRRAQLGGTTCYRGGDTYLLPNSVFVISIF